MSKHYGDKRDYKKIDIYLKRPAPHGSTYLASTTWAKTCREAVLKFCESRPGKYAASDLFANYSGS